MLKEVREGTDMKGEIRKQEVVILAIKIEDKEMIESREDRTEIANIKARDKRGQREEIVKREVKESLLDNQDTVRIQTDYTSIKLAY